MMLTLTVPVSSEVISSVSMPEAITTVPARMPTEASITSALWFKSESIVRR